jgi:hypothetical protein
VVEPTAEVVQSEQKEKAKFPKMFLVDGRSGAAVSARSQRCLEIEVKQLNSTLGSTT